MEPREGLSTRDLASRLSSPVELGMLLGQRCEVFGLSGRPDLNGGICVAKTFSAARGRYTVTMDGSDEKLRIKPVNLRLLRPADGDPEEWVAVEPAPAPPSSQTQGV